MSEAGTIRAADSMVAAETRVEYLLARVMDRLHYLNQRLLKLQAAIKAVQPMANGSIGLELYKCGPGCTGCPHPRWVQYQWRKGKGNNPDTMRCINLDRADTDPSLSISKKAPHAAQLRELVREAKAVQAERAGIFEALRPFHHIARKAG